MKLKKLPWKISAGLKAEFAQMALTTDEQIAECDDIAAHIFEQTSEQYADVNLADVDHLHRVDEHINRAHRLAIAVSFVPTGQPNEAFAMMTIMTLEEFEVWKAQIPQAE